MFGKRVTWFTAINLAVSGSYFLVISGLKRAMAPECLSEFLYTFQLSGFLIPFVLAGFAPMTYQNWSKHGDSFDIKSHNFTMLLTLVILSGVLIVIFELRTVQLICAFLLFRLIHAVTTVLTRLSSRPLHYAVYGLTYVLAFLFLFSGEDLVLSALAMVLVLWLVGYAVIIRDFTGVNRDWKSQNFLKRKGLFLLQAAASFMLVGIDKVLIREFVTDITFIDYSLAYTTATLIITPASILSQNVAPNLFNAASASRSKEVQRIVGKYAVLIFSIWLFVFLLFNNFGDVIFPGIGEVYYSYSSFLMAAAFLQSGYFILSNVLIASGAETKLVCTTIVMGCSNVVGCYLNLKFQLLNPACFTCIVWAATFIALCTRA